MDYLDTEYNLDLFCTLNRKYLCEQAAIRIGPSDSQPAVWLSDFGSRQRSQVPPLPYIWALHRAFPSWRGGLGKGLPTSLA